MHAHCFSITGKAAQFPHELNFQYSQTLQNRIFNTQVVKLKPFRACRYAANNGDTAASPLPPPPNLKGKAPRKFWNAASLAFLGDSVWEVRICFLTSYRGSIFSTEFGKYILHFLA